MPVVEKPSRKEEPLLICYLLADLSADLCLQQPFNLNSRYITLCERSYYLFKGQRGYVNVSSAVFLTLEESAHVVPGRC